MCRYHYEHFPLTHLFSAILSKTAQVRAGGQKPQPRFSWWFKSNAYSKGCFEPNTIYMINRYKCVCLLGIYKLLAMLWLTGPDRKLCSQIKMAPVGKLKGITEDVNNYQKIHLYIGSTLLYLYLNPACFTVFVSCLPFRFCSPVCEIE